MVGEVQKKFQTVDAIFSTWHNLPKSLTSSIPKHIFEVNNKNGGAPHYSALFGALIYALRM